MNVVSKSLVTLHFASGYSKKPENLVNSSIQTIPQKRRRRSGNIKDNFVVPKSMQDNLVVPNHHYTPSVQKYLTVSGNPNERGVKRSIRMKLAQKILRLWHGIRTEHNGSLMVPDNMEKFKRAMRLYIKLKALPGVREVESIN